MHGLSLWGKLGVGIGLLIVFSTLSAAGQSGGTTLSGPSLGFITDGSGTTIWPLLGILDAAVPGRAVELSEAIVNTTLSPQQNYALAIALADAQPVLIRLDGSNPQIVRLSGARPNATMIVMSPTGATAALYDRRSMSLQLVSGLPDSPRISYEFDASLLGGEVQDVAVADDASMALVNVGRDARTLWFVDVRGSRLTVNASQPSRMVFIANRHDALVADDMTQEVFMLQNLDQNPVRMPGLVFRGDLLPFSAVAASRDGRLIFASQRGSQEIVMMDTQTRRTAVVPCSCNVAVFSPLKGTSVFRVTGFPERPISVLDASSSTPRTLIIPIDPAALATPGKGQIAQ